MWTSSRKPLVGEFAFPARDVFVIANHFDAKLGDQNQDGRFQYPAQSSAVQRAGQAQVEHDFVQKLLDVDKKADVVVLGDLNDYQFSPALDSLRTGTSDGTGPSILTDLISTLPTNQQYTYVLRRRLRGARPHPGDQQGDQGPELPGRARQRRVRRPGQRPRPAGGAVQAVRPAVVRAVRL